MPNVFDERGVITQGIDDFRNDMSETAKVVFADKLEGKQLRTDDSSMLGRVFSIVSKGLVQNAEILPLIVQSLDINSAEGQQLDNLLWNIHRIKRKPAAQATGMVVLQGDIGVEVDVGSSVANSISGDFYRTDRDVTFSNIGTNGVDIEVLEVDGTYTLNYSIEGFLSNSPNIIVQKSSNDTTVRNIADRLVDAVNSQSAYLVASRNNDNSVKVVIEDQSKIGNFSVQGNIRIVRSYMPVYVTSSTYASRESLVGQVTQIRTPKIGWRGVNNPFYIFPSVGIESDEDYRYRGKLKQQSSGGKYNSILMALKSVGGVVYENVQQNTSSNATNSGITNNGVAITVMGGNEDEIALAIFNSISEGIATSGDILKLVKDINGFEHEVRFSRPKIVPLEISMSLVTYPNFPINGNARIRQAIVQWFNQLNVGEDIHYSRLYEPINSIQGFAVKNLKFGYKGGTLSLEDIIIRHDEIATLDAADIIIGGTRGSNNIVDGDPEVPTVCTPNEVPIVYDPFDTNVMSGQLTAKYRVNGGSWVNYQASIISDDAMSDACRVFFESIYTPDGMSAIQTSGNGGGAEPFFSYQARYNLTGASNNPDSMSRGQLGIVSSQPTTIEFEVVNNSPYDLVYYMFGQSVTAKSCAYGSWNGL